MTVTAMPPAGDTRPDTELIEEIRRAAPPHRTRLDGPTRVRLAQLTAQLLDARPDSAAELDRYLSIQRRTIATPDPPAATGLAGATIAVTGGSGCIGTALLSQLAAVGTARLVSLALDPPRRAVPGVRYVRLDIRTPGAVEDALRTYRPQLVFHLAAQRDPGRAERDVAATVATNLVGTWQVARAAEWAGVSRLVYASTGKAVRPFTADVYAATKRVGEQLLAAVAAGGGLRCSVARFTHVVDNSILLARLGAWCSRRALIRLHGADTLFYAQSAAESAQLLLAAAAAPADRALRVYAIRDLGWPVALLDIALGAMRRYDVVAPLYLAGHEPGYEERPYPGLYDPAVAGDVSPLLNVIETQRVEPTGAVDAATVTPMPLDDLAGCMPDLSAACLRGDHSAVRRILVDLAWHAFVATTRRVDPAVLAGITRRTARYRPAMTAEHRRIDDVFRGSSS